MDFANYWASATTTADLGETIDQSLRFTGDGRLVASTSATTGNFTISFWWKRAIGVTATHTFFMFTPNQAYQFTQNNDDRFASRVTAFDYLSDGSLRDHSAWYHIVLVNNSGTTTCYINGVQQADTATTPSGGGNMCIGSNSTSLQDDRLVGYLAEYNMLDGQTLAATDFGRYNDDGVWVPIALNFTSAQYGAKGFRLVFDSSADGGIGDDSAPTGTGHTAANDFTATGFDTAAISSSNFDNDIDYEDTPTSNYATLNPLNYALATMSNANLASRSSGSSAWQFRPASVAGQSTGKWYWEARAVGSGSSLMASIINDQYEKVNTSNIYPGQGAGAGTGGWSLYGANGRLYRNGVDQVASEGLAYGTDDILMFALDLENGAWWAGQNGTWYQSATTSEIEAGTTLNAIDTGALSGKFWPGFVTQGGTSNGWDVNFGQMPFIYTQPSGFNAWQTNNLAEPTIKNGSDHFRALTGTGANILAIAQGTNTSGTNWNPDVDTGFTNGLWWIKDRQNSNQHQLVDSVRGGNLALQCPNKQEAAYIAPAGNSVAWCWNAPDTFTPTVTGGLTNVTARRNVAAGFSMIAYTGSAQTGTITHGLDESPEFMITKIRSAALGGTAQPIFQVRHKDLTGGMTSVTGAGGILSLNLANAQFANTHGTVTVTADGTGIQTNIKGGGSGTADADWWQSGADGENYIAYCWHSVPGFSAFGSYTANGNADGPFVFLGFRPSFLLIKATGSVSGGWGLYDSTRFTNNPVNGLLYANSTNIESAFVNRPVDFLSNGFKIRDSNLNLNSSGDYVYMAFAENPFGGENAPPATAR